MLVSWKKSCDKPRHHIKNQKHHFADKGLSSQSYSFSSSHVWMWELDYKESWVPKNWDFWTVVLEKTLESPLDCKEINPKWIKSVSPLSRVFSSLDFSSHPQPCLRFSYCMSLSLSVSASLCFCLSVSVCLSVSLCVGVCVCECINRFLVSCKVVSSSFVTSWTVAHQATLFMEFHNQEY